MTVQVSNPRYPRKAEIARAVAAAREAGINPSGIEIGADGMIRVLGEQMAGPDNAYDRWKATRRRD